MDCGSAKPQNGRKARRARRCVSGLRSFQSQPAILMVWLKQSADPAPLFSPVYHSNECNYETAKMVPASQSFNWFNLTRRHTGLQTQTHNEPPIKHRFLERRRRRVWSRAPPTLLFFIVHLRLRHKRSLVVPEFWPTRYINDT